MKSTLRGILFIYAASFAGCQDPSDGYSSQDILVDSVGRHEKSTSAGNLITTAMKLHYLLDIVFYPSEFIKENSFSLVSVGMEKEQIQSHLFSLYEENEKDLFRLGTMNGKALKEFVLKQTLLKQQLDLEVAGLQYSILLKGGYPAVFHIRLEDGSEIDDDRYYRVAVSDYLFGPPRAFPGYIYGAGLQRGFRRESGTVSGREALVRYIGDSDSWSDFGAIRAEYKSVVAQRPTQKISISQLQGEGHMSPFLGQRVAVQGIVTAVGKAERGDGIAFYLQSSDGDGNDVTSEGVYAEMSQRDPLIKVGNEVWVAGIVYEDLAAEGLTRTGLKEIGDVKLVGSGVQLPEPILIGPDGRRPPDKILSSYRGNLNQKAHLVLTDAIDFWESLEGMRVRVQRPKVVGVAGGRDDLYEVKSYLNIFVAPSGYAPLDRLMVSKDRGFAHPAIIRISDHDYSKDVDTNATFNVGDIFDYDITGVFDYRLNPFGGGEYTLFPFGLFKSTSPLVPVARRPQTPLHAVEGQLSIANFNVENLSFKEGERLQQVADVISLNLACPDIVNLVEIQDNNGEIFGGGAAADMTLNGIIHRLACPEADYQALNIDPLNHREGGKPGGNIRVAMIFNRSKVGFARVGAPDSLKETYVKLDGHLSQNPGRVFPNDPVFSGTRRPLVAEFSYANRRIFVIGNHFNSKGGDASAFAAQQPPVFHSEYRRSRIARKIHEFAQRIRQNNPAALIVVLGDFNDYQDAMAIETLKGDLLHNLMDDCAADQRYSYNYGGNSQALDHIFVSKNLYKELKADFDILHLNTEYMGRVSDHDPMVARFDFTGSGPEPQPCRHHL